MNQYTRYIEQNEGGATTATPLWYDRTETTQKTVPCMRKDSTIFIITGDTARNKVQVMPGGNFSTAAVEVPVMWDSIMAAKGYPALSSMYLTQTGDNTPTNISTVNTDNVPVHQCGTMIINENNARIAIFDAAGKMIASTTGNYNLINLPTGVYFVRVAGYKGVACKVVKN